VRGGGDASLSAEGPSDGPAVVLIALDGVRWQELFVGCEVARSRDPGCADRKPMPNIARLAYSEGAALGAPGRSAFSVAGPTFISLPGYQQMFTGRRHVACTSNECDRVADPTIAEAVAQRYGRAQVAVFSSWAGVGRAAAHDARRVELSCGRDGPDAAYRQDDETAELALAHARRDAPRFLFVGLGDTDEAAHTGDYDAYLAALQRADAWVARFVDWARQRTADGHPTTVFVTTDHGRSRDFKEHERALEAGAGWLVATGPAVKVRGLVAAGPRALADLAPTIADVLGVTLPRAEGVPIVEFGGKPRRRPQRLALLVPHAP
jgi:hypothetical protein